ncbi:MAG: hypothetical protein CMG66_01845 [Candidatus Marinimicrobia bacterium]|nr:hypothetical protein [Candidatus Neomarinimicrobiota bacterium]
MFKQAIISFVVWFRSTAHWWFRTLFGRLGILFACAAFVLVFLTYYVFNSGVADKDNILDMYDAYYHYKFVETWGDFSDTTSIRKELNNLRIDGKIYSIEQRQKMLKKYNLRTTSDLCSLSLEKKIEQSLLYWTNSTQPFSICDYTSYQWSDVLSEQHSISFDGYVSFGDIQIDNRFYPATVIEKDGYQILLITTDYQYSSDWVSLAPVISLILLFMTILYFLIRRFLKPITLMQKRIYALEKGDLNSKIQIIGKDELALLSQNFNKLIDEIKKLLKQKERLLADVSHEIRTPLAKMRLLTEIKKQPAEQLTHINKQIDVLDSIVTNILISDKLAAPYSNLKIEKISIQNLLNQGLELSKNKRVVVESKEKFFVFCDVVKIAIVLKNLLDNAEKYAPSSRPVSITYTQKKGLVSISCRDFGPGIPEDLIEKIMKPYVRGANLNKSGFGLGLSICKRILGAHKGNISILNNKEEGSTFTISWNSAQLKEKT